MVYRFCWRCSHRVHARMLLRIQSAISCLVPESRVNDLISSTIGEENLGGIERVL